MITYLNLCTSHNAIQGCGHTMSLAVVGESSLWLSLYRLTDKDKVDLLDAHVTPKELFGSAVTAMLQNCDMHMKEGKAFNSFLPHSHRPRDSPLFPATI